MFSKFVVGERLKVSVSPKNKTQRLNKPKPLGKRTASRFAATGIHVILLSWDKLDLAILNKDGLQNLNHRERETTQRWMGRSRKELARKRQFVQNVAGEGQRFRLA